MNPIALIEKTINEHGSSAILKERLELFKDILSKVEKEKADLETKVSRLIKEVEELKKQLPDPDFVEYLGVKFKRKKSGGYQHAVFCPSCDLAMAGVRPGIPFTCMKCGYMSSFHVRKLNMVIKEVSEEHPDGTSREQS